MLQSKPAGEKEAMKFFTAAFKPHYFSQRRNYQCRGRHRYCAAAVFRGRDPTKDIQLYINSPGGSVTAGFAIYDTVQYLQCNVSTICVGLAASFGAFLLAGGTKGKRIALPNAEIMIHQPLIGGQGVRDPASDIQIVSAQMQKTKQLLTRLLAENTGRTLSEVAAATERDRFMTATEALAFGLIDKIIDKR